MTQLTIEAGTARITLDLQDQATSSSTSSYVGDISLHSSSSLSPPYRNPVPEIERSQRFTKIDQHGLYLPAGSTGTDHVAVIDNTTGLMWAVKSLGDEDNPEDGIAHEHAMQRCRDLRLLAFEDWRLPTRSELAALIDDTRHEPAIDTDAFPFVKPRWHWTSTLAAWSSASAWGVYFDYGLLDDLHRDANGFALAVRRAGQ